MMKKSVLFAWVLCCWCALSAQPVAQRLDALLKSSPLLETSEVGITVFDLTSGKSLFRHQDRKLYRPASVEKIITSVTALSRLGEDYTFDTRLAYTGLICGDTLKGDLYVVGGLDPEFMEDDLKLLARSVGDAGIRCVQGQLLGDVSLIDSLHWGPGWSWDDTPSSFQPYISPLMLNRGCVSVRAVPGRKGEKPLVQVSPESDYYRIANEAESRNPGCGKFSVTRDWLHNGNIIRLSGNVASSENSCLNVYSSKDFFMQTFRYQLEKQGVCVRSLGWGVCPSGAVDLHVCRRPMEVVLKRALKKSDNLAAEAMFLHLGVQESDTVGAGFPEGQAAVGRFMKQEIGFSPKKCQIVDGSGVSLYNYISPALLLAYLKYAYRDAGVFPLFSESLPVAGVDGTLCNRMKQGKAYRNVHAKTGSVTGVSSLAGYVRTAKGHWLAFVIINQNVLKAHDARMFQDKVCEILAGS